ncbi:hypothetical protein KFL_002960140 [Klebsormidium nitens]|uniref:Uncharacterized protein n=1 Tax=Klebsormidium nitens TaxID=105231 RepID=A0A1Y1IAV3_KLENI|nr:hypothetical protein KFL_002960140 [Klebsormidium nitens]|eukprot:GAQ86559.1 hypothetical protein KFL_002960140 [Klebsormidium nitens]
MSLHLNRPEPVGPKNKKRQFLGFILDTFAAKTKGETAKPLRIKRGSTELWRPVLKEFERALVSKGPDWTSPEAAHLRAKVQQLLTDLEAFGKTFGFWGIRRYSPWSLVVYDDGYVSRNAEKLCASLKAVKEKVAAADKEAAQVALEAKKEPIKASLKLAPWEVN